MSDGELKFPQWQAPLQDLILEFDREKLPEKIQNIKSLIVERLQQLSHESDGQIERDALNYALGVLPIITADKLDYPDWRK